MIPTLTLLLAQQVASQIAETRLAEASSFVWADVDGDGRLDLAAMRADGTVQLLLNSGAGHFEDATERFGLSEVTNAALLAWADYDADRRLDVFIGAREGASRLYHNEGGSFVDLSAGSGLVCNGPVREAYWFDHDGDTRLDLVVLRAEKNELFRGLEGGFFEPVELPLAASSGARSLAGGAFVASAAEGNHEPTSDRAQSPGRHAGTEVVDDARPPSRSSLVLGSASGPGGLLPIVATPGVLCAGSVEDLGAPGNCLQASSVPTLGKVYPLSANLFVSAAGRVGIGTTTPTTKLEVAGTTRMTGTLTLAPAIDQALNISTGSIYKGGALFIHTKGEQNMAHGYFALASVTSGYWNTATGFRALQNDTTGSYNSAHGFEALRSNTSGYWNTASGFYALHNNTTGDLNTASGYKALSSNTTGYHNTASGSRALRANTTGFYNTACGAEALYSNTTGVLNTASGDRALKANTIGTFNTASGAKALYSNTTGSSNTANGADALYSNTTGSSNTACGDSALNFNTTGFGNMASGNGALRMNTTGLGNMASGFDALYSNTTGTGNTASGYLALKSNTTGPDNTASGNQALKFNTTGARNTASGYRALISNTTGGYNTACGHRALDSNTTGSRNIALGRSAGLNLTTGNDNIAIGNAGVAAEASTTRIGTAGTQTRAFMAGIRGVTTANANAIPVLIDSAGQLGTGSSSRRFKEEIRDMGDATKRLLELRPVVFRFKPEVQSGERPLEYGLIAEEVAEVFPDLVVYDDEGLPLTVKYHIMSAMLLNELKKQALQTEGQRDDLEQQRDELLQLGKQLQEQRRELTGQKEALQDRDRILEERVTQLESLEMEVASLKATLQKLIEAR